MNKEDIIITARCAKCDGVSKITKPEQLISENIECQICHVRTHVSLWTQMYISDIDYESRNDFLENEVLQLAEDNAKLKKGIKRLKSVIELTNEQLEILQKRGSKEDFLIKYVLGSIGSPILADEAWGKIQESCKPETKDE